MNLPGDTLLNLYREMLRIRRAELKIESLYHEDEMKTPIHLCNGQEAIAVGVCANLAIDDPIFTTYRSHGQYLAKGGSMKAMMAELHCKETGCSKGRGGSMHLVDLSVGHYGSSAIVAGSIPIATGMALAKQMKGESAVTTVFFGDGATDEGAFYESVNFAMLKQLPILYIYENNQWAVCSHVSARKAGECLYHEADPDLLFSTVVDGNSVLDVYEAATRAVERARTGRGPSFIECKTYRIRGHAGSGPDTGLGYRTVEEVAEWEARCPVETFRETLLADGQATQDALKEMERTIDAEIEDAFEFARKGPLPKGEDVLLNLYRE